MDGDWVDYIIGGFVKAIIIVIAIVFFIGFAVGGGCSKTKSTLKENNSELISLNENSKSKRLA